MKTSVLFAMSIIIFFTALSGATADENSTQFYSDEIDKMILSYQGRLHLVDSNFKILSNIGKEAQKKIAFLQSRKQSLIAEMKAGNIEPVPSKIKSFISRKLTKTSETGLAYIAP